MLRVLSHLILFSSFVAPLAAQEKLPFEFLKMERVYKGSRNPHDGELMFSSDSASLLIGIRSVAAGFDRWTRYSLLGHTYSEYGPATIEKLGPQLIGTLPPGYAFHNLAQGARLISEDADRLYFHVSQSGMVVSTDQHLQDMKIVVRNGPRGQINYFEDKHTGCKAYNGQHIYDANATTSDANFFFFNAAMQVVPLVSQKGFRKNYDEMIAGNSTLQAAIKKDNQFFMLTAGGKLPLKPRLLAIAPEDNQRYCTAFYANEDKWFCVVLDGDDKQRVRIVWFDSQTGNHLGTFEFPDRYQFRRSIDKPVRSDKQGKLVVVTTTGAAAILQVENERFELLADDSHLPRLALLHNTAVQFAVSPNGETIALHVAGKFEDTYENRIALIKVSDIKRLRASAISSANEMLIQASLPKGEKTLLNLKKSEIPIALQHGDEPDSIVHLIDLDAKGLAFSSDARWLFAGDALFDAADGDLIERFTEYAERHFGLKRFKIVRFCLTDDAQRMATISDQLTIWDLSKKDPILVHAFTTKDLDEKYIDEFSEASEFMFLPGANQERLLLRSKNKIWLLSIAGETLQVLDSRPRDFFVNRWGQLSYSKDGNTIYAEALGGAIRGYDIRLGSFEITSLIKPEGIESRPQDKYTLFTRPLDWVYLHHDRDDLVLQFKAAQLSQVKKFPFALSGFGYDSASGYVTTTLKTSRATGTTLARMIPDFSEIKQTILAPQTYGSFAIANDGSHVAVVHNKRVWILREKFLDYSLSSATTTPQPAAPSAFVRAPPTEEEQGHFNRVVLEYNQRVVKLPAELREKYRKKLGDGIETHKKLPANSQYIEFPLGLFEQLIQEMKNEAQ